MATSTDSKADTRQVGFRVPLEEHQAWRVAAAIRGVSLSEWMRTVLTATARATKEQHERDR